MRWVHQAIQHDAEEVIKWDRAMQRCHQTLADSARYAAWQSVRIYLSLNPSLACTQPKAALPLKLFSRAASPKAPVPRVLAAACLHCQTRSGSRHDRPMARI